MKLLIILHHRFELWNAPPWLTARLRQDFPQLEVVNLPSYERINHEIANAEIYFGWSIRPEQFKPAKKLRWIHSPVAAVHELMIPEVVASSVVITNARDVHGSVVAEHAMALMLALAKRLPTALVFQAQRLWGQEQLWKQAPRPRELSGSCLLLVGLGTIGRDIVRQAKAFGMQVIGVRDRPMKGSEGADEVMGPSHLDHLLPHADFVVICAPLTPETEGLISRERLLKMKPSAYLVNVSRGPVVDEPALAEILKAKKIAGAALDVFAEEPLPHNSPFWSLENVLITPHSATLTEKVWERHYSLMADNVRRYLLSQPLRNVVDKTKGY